MAGDRLSGNSRPRRTKLESDDALAACFKRYEGLRADARNIARDTTAADGVYALFTAIDTQALKAVAEQWASPPRRVMFPWETGIMRVLRKSHPRRFDVAIWNGPFLCGLAVARLSDSKEWLSFTHLEAGPSPTRPLKRLVLPLAITAGGIFADLVQQYSGANSPPTIRFMNPLREAIDWYAQQGYSRFHQANGYSFITEGGTT